MLGDRACLLIVDDVWRKADLDYFCTGAPNSRLLITTHDAAIVEDFGAEVKPIPLMAGTRRQPHCSNCGLAQNRDLISTTDKRIIVDRLGRLPLAIRLAGPQLRSQTADKWLAAFGANKLKSRRQEAVHDNLSLTIGLSLDSLQRMHRNLFVALAVFPEDEPLHTGAIAKLWHGMAGLSHDESEELLSDLVDRALLQQTVSDQRRTPAPTIGGEILLTLHDLIRDIMLDELRSESLLIAHRSLVASYRSELSGDWGTLSDDGYICDHLTYHLEHLAKTDRTVLSELVELFADQSWMHLRFAQTRNRYDRYLADLDRCWRLQQQCLVEAIRSRTDPSPILANVVRFALIRTSIVSLAANYVPALVVQAVKTGVWSFDEAYSIAQYVPDPIQRCEILVQTAKLKPQDTELEAQFQKDALAAIQAITDEHSRAQMLAELLNNLTGPLREQVLRDAVAAAQLIKDDHGRAEALTDIASRLTGPYRDRVLHAAQAAAESIRDHHLRTGALTNLALHSTRAMRANVLRKALVSAQAVKDKGSRVAALTNLAPQLQSSLRKQMLQEALAVAQTVRRRLYFAHAQWPAYSPS